MSSHSVTTEKDVQVAVLQWLNFLPGCCMWRQNTGGRHWTDNKGKSRYQKLGEPGQPDTTGLVHGIRCEIEVKRPGHTPSENQKTYIQMIRDHGGIAFWCDNLRSCIDQMRDEFERRGWTWSKSWEVW